jgi:hypothetical protein
VIEVGQGTEEFGRSPSFVSDNETFLPTSLDLKDLHHGAITRLDAPENILIDFEGILRRLLKENGIGNGPDVCLSVRASRSGWGVRETTLVDKVTPQLLGSRR